MSDEIKHECGISLIRLRKPYQYYIDKYGTPLYGINKLYMLMDKLRNRGQDGAGVAVIKTDVTPGIRYISRYRSMSPQAIEKIFKKISKKFKKVKRDAPEKLHDAHWLKENVAFTGEVLLGHLRYGTHGSNTIESCHPFLRQNNWRSRNLVVAGNFNMTNVEELFGKLISLGQHPKEKVDTVTVMEKIGHFLDEEVQRNFNIYKDQYENEDISHVIEEKMDIQRILHRSCRDFDGGYAMVGVFGHGSAYVMRDPSGIRPAYYYADDEVVVVASEKPAIKTSFGIEYSEIKEIKPGHALIIEKDGSFSEKEVLKPLEKRPCSFERIYFSRGSDPNIYEERKKLGRFIVPQVLEAIDYDVENTVFSYIPNTAEVAFYGMVEGIEEYLMMQRKEVILEGRIQGEELDKILSFRPRVEKMVIKDVKARTFITDDSQRDAMVSHVYDTTYEVINKGKDTIVLIDDSIVRGTTLEKSILRMLDKLEPKKIIIVSSAPQIRYPDCYGIDMSRMKDFVAFRAALKLWEDKGNYDKVYEILDKCQDALKSGLAAEINLVKDIYRPFTPTEISDKIAQIIRPKDLKAEVQVIYQTIENLHTAIPHHSGDWYFTGNYPTPGGFKVVNKAFINHMQGKLERAY
jgi:amidophosphoribosyltransferase